MTDFKASLEAAAETHICNYPDRRDANWRFIQGALWTLDSAVVREMAEAGRTLLVADVDEWPEARLNWLRKLAAYEQARKEMEG